MSERLELEGLILELGDQPWSSVKRMALHLGGMNADLLQSIEEESEDRLYRAMQKWLQRDVGASWDQLVQALRKVELNVLAEKIHATHCSGVATPETKTSAANPSPRRLRPLPSTSTHEGATQSDEKPADVEAASVSLTLVGGVSTSSSEVSDEIAQSVSPQAQVSSPASDTMSSHVIPTKSTAVVAQLEERIKKIEDEIANLKAQFSDVRIDTHVYMRERETKEAPSFLERFRVTMADLPLQELEGTNHPHLFDQYYSMLRANYISEIFIILNPYSNYMNYGLLRFMVDKFGDSSLKEKMGGYASKLETFEVETTVNEFAAASPGSFEIPKHYRSVIVKINKDALKYTLYDVREFVLSVTKRSSLYPYALMMEKLCVNTVVVHLGVPRQALARVSMAFDSVFLELHCIISVLIDGWKPQDFQLLGASEEGDSAMVSALIEAGVSLDIRSTDMWKWTPLHFACASGHVTVVEILLDRGSDLRAQDRYQQTPLHLACWRGHVTVVKILLDRGSDLREQDKYQQTPLHFACQRGHVTVVKILLDRGSDLRAQDHIQQTPLHLACEGGHVTVVKILLDRGSDLRAQDIDQQTPLHLACEGGHVTVVKILLDRGSDLRAQDWSGRTPLIIAAWWGKVDVVKVLSERGADLNTQDNSGRTPLITAAEYGKADVVKVLSERGADLNTQANRGISALMYASLRKDWICTLTSREEVVQVLVEKGADANLQDEEGLTALMMATKEGRTSTVKILLRSKHMDVNIQENSVGWSALFYAAKDGHLEIARLLVSAGANTLLRDQNDVTALDTARVHAHQEICELLTQQMAKSTTPSQQPERPLQFLRRLVGQSGEKAVAAYKRLEKWLKSTEQKERLLKKQRAMAKAREEEEEEERKKMEQSQLVMTIY